MTFDQVMDKIGGFGKFQWLACVILITTKMTGDFVINCLAFNELMPKYECRPHGSPSATEWVSCTQTDFCPNLGGSEDLDHRVDW